MLFAAVATLFTAFIQAAYIDTPRPTLDALRYVDYALNIHDHGVFGLSGADRANVPQPGNANSPLYPALLAFAIGLDPELRHSLNCALTMPGQNCPNELRTIVALQLLISIATACLVWLAATHLFARRGLAWIAALLVLASTKTVFFANHLLTEILVLLFFSALLCSLIRAVQTHRRRWWAGVGFVLGALTLTRPEYLYVAIVLALLGLGAALAGRTTKPRSALAAGVFAFAIVVAPWLARNAHHFGTASVTGGYADIILAYRCAYNDMTLQEWGASFIYWLPGYGEVLAGRLLPESSYSRLGTDADDLLFTGGREIFNRGLAAVDGQRERLAGYLIKTEILGRPLQHAFASIPLAWRGVLAGKYLAIPGLPCLAVLLIIALRRRNWVILVAVLPAAFLVALYAAVSASVPRYNVHLIFYYGIAVSWMVCSLIERRFIAARMQPEPSTANGVTGWSVDCAHRNPARRGSTAAQR